MHILEHLYLLDFFNDKIIKEAFPDVIVREVEETDFAQKVFFVSIEEGVEMILETGIYLGDNESVYIETHIYIVKNHVWIEEYDLVYLKNFQKEAKVLVKFARDAEKELKEEIRVRGLPIKVYNTTKQKFNVAKNITKTEKEEALLAIDEFEYNELPAFKNEIEDIVREENEKIDKLRLEDTKEVERVIAKSLVDYYDKRTDQALKDRNKGDFMLYSELLNQHIKKLKKLYL